MITSIIIGALEHAGFRFMMRLFATALGREVMHQAFDKLVDKEK